MNKAQLTQSLKDIVPTYSGDYPPQLLSYIDSIYQLSLQKIPVLPNRADVARYHLCAYLAVERSRERFSLPEPLTQRIPLQPKLVNKVLEDLQERVVFNSPTSTPRKRTSTPANLPQKHTPSVGSPLKKLRTLQEDIPPSFSQASPFNPGKEASNYSLRDAASPFNTKIDASPTRSKALSKSPVKTPRKSPSKSSASTPSSPRYIRHLSIADFISFANNFYIPANVTPHMIETFVAEKHKFTKKNEWLLACGLVHAAYIRINHKLLNSTIGKKTELQDQFFQYQKGGLMKWNMVMWINIIEESVKSEPWVIDLELKYVHNDWSTEDNSTGKEIAAKLGRGWELLQAFGSMKSPSVMFDAPSQVKYYETWTNRVLAKLEGS